MILTPLAGAISQYQDGDAIGATSKGLLLYGTTAVPGVAHPIRVTSLGRVELDGFSGRIPLNEHAENATVVGATESTILSYVPTAAAYVQGLLLTGTAAGRWKLKVAGTTKAIARTTAARTTENISFADGPVPASIGQTILITGFHEETANQALAANLFGYTI